MGRKCILLFAACAVLFVAGCDNGTSARKEQHRPQEDRFRGDNLTAYFTYADNKAWDYGQLEIKKSIERQFFTTKNEVLFTVERHDISNIHTYYKFANLLFLCDVSSKQPVSEYVKDIIPGQAATIGDSLPATNGSSKRFMGAGPTCYLYLGKRPRTTASLHFLKI